MALLDLVMPELDGYALADRVRATTSGADLPIVILSSVGSRDRLGTEVEPHADPMVVRLTEAAQRLVLVDREGEVATADQSMFVERAQTSGVPVPSTPHAHELLGQRVGEDEGHHGFGDDGGGADTPSSVANRGRT